MTDPCKCLQGYNFLMKMANSLVYPQNYISDLIADLKLGYCPNAREYAMGDKWGVYRPQAMLVINCCPRSSVEGAKYPLLDRGHGG